MKTLIHKHNRFLKQDWKLVLPIVLFLFALVFSSQAEVELQAGDATPQTTPTPTPTPFPAPQFNMDVQDTAPTREFRANNSSMDILHHMSGGNNPPTGPSHRDSQVASLSLGHVDISFAQITDADNDPFDYEYSFNGNITFVELDRPNKIAHVYYNFSQIGDTAEITFQIFDVYNVPPFEAKKSAGFIYIVDILGLLP